MKIRTDVVTNSSSSSFLLGFKDKNLTAKQKDAIVEYVLGHALGKPATDEDLEDWYGYDDYDYDDDFDDEDDEDEDSEDEDEEDEDGEDEDEEEDSDEEEYDKDTDLGWAKTLQKDGWTVRLGVVHFDGVDGQAYFLRGLWDAIARADPDNTELIDTDLSY